MPRNLLNESSIPADKEYKAGNFEKRRTVLRDTVERLSSEEYRDQCRQQASKNHARWSGAAHESAGRVRVIAGDWGEVTQQLSKENGAVYAAINMANAHEPGGGYTQGYGAQEENMFRRTDCHFFITDEMMDATKNEYIPKMTALINATDDRVYLDRHPRICIKGKEDPKAANLGYPDLDQNDYFLFYELRSAADNLVWDDATNDFFKPPKPFDEVSMRKKIAAQLDTLIEKNIRHVVLSAFGCGAFGNPADRVAQVYKEELEKRTGHFDDVAFAVFYAGYGPDNFTPFKQILDGLQLTKAVTSRPSSAGVFAQSQKQSDDPGITEDKSTKKTPGSDGPM